jgi:REP element-mobilizing transposase RayT
VHITLRARRGLQSLRSERAFQAFLRALEGANADAFRVVHFSVQTDHVHLIVEADSADHLRSGLNGLTCRAARALNRVWRRRGSIWGDRYHARALTTPREVRHGLVYVLLNFRKHLRAPPLVDPRSSGAWFDGWSHAQQTPPRPSPVAAPRTWLASVGWRRGGGPIDVRELPASRSSR